MNGEEAEFLFTARDNRGIPGAFDYYRGPTGHVFIAQVPADLEAHYEGGYQSVPETEAELAELARGDAYRLEPIRALVPSGAYLEIGPWIGLVAYSAHQMGYDVTVLERNAACVGLLGNVGINAVQTDDPAQTLAASRTTYDVVGLWHSIEHLPRPWEVLDQAAKHVAPGGVLLVAAPNPESAQMRVTQQHWRHLDAPRHLHLLPSADVAEIGRRNGLKTIELTTNDQLGQILDEDGWMFEALRKRLGRFPLLAKCYARQLARRHRSGNLDGAGYTIIMQRQSLSKT